MLRVLGLLALLASVTTAQLTRCDPANFKLAQNDFAKRLHLPERDDWHHPLDLFGAIQNYYGSHPEHAHVDVCNAFNALLNDLNEHQLRAADCFDPVWLLSNDDTPEDAIDFLGVIGYLRFQCGAGFYVTSQRFDCVSRTFASQSQSMLDAVKATLVDAKYDNFNRCAIIKRGELQYVKPLNDECADYQTSWWGCQSYQAFFGTIYEECDSECTLRVPQGHDVFSPGA